jgi:hypothetical protein
MCEETEAMSTHHKITSFSGFHRLSQALCLVKCCMCGGCKDQDCVAGFTRAILACAG